MSQSKREDRKNKWLRLAVGATLLAGASGAVLPGMASAAEANVSGGMSTEEKEQTVAGKLGASVSDTLDFTQ